MTSAVVPYIPVDAPDELKEYARKAIVWVKHETFPRKGKDGTAFFVRYKSEADKICHALMTNHHVINFDPDEPIVGCELEYPPAPLTFSLSSEKLQFTEELKLEESSISYAFSCSRLDVTLLEFSQEGVERFTAKEVEFLDMERDVNASYGDCLHIYGHPASGSSRGPLCKGKGRLVGQPTPLICYSVDTAPGFSGSPIFKVIMVDRHKNSFRYQLVGIHHRAGDKEKYNCGTPIETVFRAIDRDRPIALQEDERQYPRQQTDDAEADPLIQHLFKADLAVATGFEPRPFIHTKYYDKPRLYEIASGKVKMTLRHSLEWDQFTLIDVLDEKHLAVPWRDWDFSLREFKAFHKLTTALQRVCSLEISEYTGKMIVTSLEEHLQQTLDKFSLAGYYCRDGTDQHKMDTIQKLKWAVMGKEGPRYLTEALVKAKGIHSNEHLLEKLNQFKCNEATEVELVEVMAICLEVITSQLRIYGCPPAELEIHVQRVAAVTELSSLVKKSLCQCGEDKAAVSVWGMGGLGKTRLLLDVVQSAIVQREFPNLIWHEVGQLTNTTLDDNIKRLAENIGADCKNYMENNITAIKRKLQEPQFKDTVLVIDNVWSSDVAKHFLFGFPTIFTSRVRLITGTNQRLVSYPVPNGFEQHETTELFNKCMQNDEKYADTSERAAELCELRSLCGGHPLTIAIMARNICRYGWDVLTAYREAGLNVAVLSKDLLESESEQRHRNVSAMLTTTMSMMESGEQNCLHALRICKRGAKLTRNALKSLWTGCVDKPVEEANHLCNQAWLQEEQPDVFTLHDVIFDFVRETATSDLNCHMEFIQNFERHICPLEQVPQQDSYMTTHCGYHLLNANLTERWVELFVHNIDFLEAVGGCGIDLFDEFSLAERLFLEEERLKEQNDNAQTNGPAVYFASFYHKIISKLNPAENTHAVFVTEVSQLLLQLMKLHGSNCERERQKTQEIAISQITRMLSKAVFANFRRLNAASITADSMLAVYLRATEVAEKGLTLISSIKGQTAPAEIQRLVAEMHLLSFFQIDEDGETCMHAAVRHEQPVVVLDILKNAQVWNKHSMIQHQEMMDAIERLKVAGSTALLELYKNFEDEFSSNSHDMVPVLFGDLEKFTIEPRTHLLSTLTTESVFNGTSRTVVKAVLQSFIFQTRLFEITQLKTLKFNRRAGVYDNETSRMFGIWFIFAFSGIQSMLVNLCSDNLASESKIDLSWKGLINVNAQSTLSNRTNINEETVLHFASRLGSTEVVTKLLTEANTFGVKHHQTYVKHEDCDGWTALHVACSNGHWEIANQLLNHSADLLTKTRCNETCLQLAVRNGHLDVVQGLLTHLQKKTDQDTFAQHLNHHGLFECTALQWACNGIQIVKQLLCHAPDLFQTNNNGWTCLHFAALQGNQDIAELLIAHARNIGGKHQKLINHRTNYGATALQIAATEGRTKMVDVLLNYSADYLNADDDGSTCLQDAVSKSRSSTVSQLLRYVSNTKGQEELKHFIDHQDKQGETALHQACSKCLPEIVNVLLSHMADCLLQDNTGETCLQKAVVQQLDWLGQPSVQQQQSVMTIVKCIVQHVKDYEGQQALSDLIKHRNKRELTAIDLALSFEDNKKQSRRIANQNRVVRLLLDNCTKF